MRRTLITVLCAALSGAGAAAAQDDDWEFQEDAARGIAVAAARYEAGQMIVVQCREGALTAVLTGLPEAAESLQLNAARADGRADRQTFLPAGAPGAYRSSLPGRDVRFMRGGGAYTVRTAEGAATAFRGVFDLPGQSANLDRVLTACGWAVTDERDQIARAPDGTSLVDPDARPRRPTRRGATTRARRQEIALPPRPDPPAEHQASCIVRALRLTECRREHPSGAEDPAVVRGLALLDGLQVYGVEAVEAEGKVLYPGGGSPLIVVTRERLL